VRRPLKDFYNRKKHVARCRLCQKADIDARIARKLAYAQQIKLEAGCMDCGLMSPYPEVYDFDHRPGVAKVKDVSRLYFGPMHVLVAEIAKCDIVCANCHRIRTTIRKMAAGGNGQLGVDRPRRPIPLPVDLDPMLDFGWDD
jgi:hypothetical protein